MVTDGSWSYFKDKVYNTSVSILGYSKKQNQDWFDDNNERIEILLMLKYDIHKRLLNTHLSAEDRSLYEQPYKTFSKVLFTESFVL